jgi:predicted nucleic acid-binding protein
VTLVVPPTPVDFDESIPVGLATGEEPAISAALAAARGGGMLLAPAHIWIETANALVRGRRRSPLDVAQVLEDMARLGIETADRGLDGLLAAVGLADRHQLSVYDAAYLWLAIDVEGELATLDRQLARAAAAEGVGLAIEL